MQSPRFSESFKDPVKRDFPFPPLSSLLRNPVYHSELTLSYSRSKQGAAFLFFFIPSPSFYWEFKIIYRLCLSPNEIDGFDLALSQTSGEGPQRQGKLMIPGKENEGLDL